jgi:hypothetical protein
VDPTVEVDILELSETDDEESRSGTLLVSRTPVTTDSFRQTAPLG